VFGDYDLQMTFRVPPLAMATLLGYKNEPVTTQQILNILAFHPNNTCH
jgi:hypothetical protein